MKKEVAVVGSGPAGLVAAFALHNDLQRKFNAPALSLDGHSYEYVEPQSKKITRVDVPMRVFSGRYYQNLFNLLEYLRVPTIERRFLFAFADDVATISNYYFFHPSNNHRLPIICLRAPGILGLLSGLWTSFIVLCCYIWFSVACFWISPRVLGRKSAYAETIGEYLTRLRLPKFFIEGYAVPLFSSVASSPHNLFLQFPAIYLTDYKRQTHMFPHKTSITMSLLQGRLVQGISVVYNAKVTGIEPSGKRLNLHYQDTKSGTKLNILFDNVVLAVNPKQTSAIYPPTSYVMDKLQISDVSVVVHQDYDMLPEGSAQLVQHSRSELIAMQMKRDHIGGKTTIATHAHPCGVLSTVWPGNSNLMDLDQAKVLHESRFVRLLATPTSRDYLATMFRERDVGDSNSTWRNGDDGVYVCGGWAWDGFALLEGCVWSGLSSARSIGAVLPWKPVERTWHK
ncbi:FAD/NAD(P)-binding domain-containing protein [Mollisia scopiformis]|uniref:FAD/NAD(P)-binding domain-containing protein n=1 Tax=Mollisia scopiformis TaxID=149040 RepID=A0A194WX39_MOLSC|nr:FAD/NAD(P)-binding domain-containing protein [Mollisia scopiformis]KUJ12152.1 FAD/NAD(P)-binding domain-containing protein [Mollisia scopiformis]